MIARLRSDTLFRDTAMVMVAAMSGNVFVLLYQLVMGHQLGVARFGELNALIGLSVLAQTPGTALNTVITKFAAEAHATGDPGRMRSLARLIGLGFLGLAGLYIVVGAIAAIPLAGFFHVPAWAIFATAVIAASFAASTAARAFVQGRQDFSGYSVATVVDGAARVVFGAPLVAIGFGLAGALGGLLVAGVLGLGYAMVRIAPVFATSDRGGPKVDWRRVALTIYASAIATLCVNLLSYGDIAIVKHFFDPHSAGIYAAVALCGKIMLFLANFAPAVLLPKVVDQLGRGQRTRGTLFAVLGVAVAMSVVGLAVFAFAPRLIVDIVVGGKFAAATPYLWVYAGAMALLGMTNLLVAYAIGIHRMTFGLPFLAVSLAGLATIWFFHPSIGAVVAILAGTNAVALLAVAASVALGGPTATGPLEPMPVSPVG